MVRVKKRESMNSTMLNIILLGTLVSCGAAKNSKSREGDNATPPPANSQQAASSIELQGKLRSQMYRYKGSEQFTYTGEIKNIQKNDLPLSHRTIPNIEYDIDAKVEHVKPFENPAVICGNSNDQSIKGRHADCFAKHPLKDFVEWSGKNQGISGEGDWQLISNSKGTEDSNKIVWQDFSTSYLWSDVMDGYSWEEAAGIGATNLENRPCQAKLDSPKHELGRINPDIVSWRLPNRNEFLQADLNGSRFVLPNTKGLVWTASYAGDNKAWAINVATGELIQQAISTTLAVRCIGVVLK